MATYRYQDDGLRKLTAPGQDAEALAEVLRNPKIANFEVSILVNKPLQVVGGAIGDLYRNRSRDDLTLLYFTGHGLKDDDGRLYLAMTNTRRDNLLFTALSAHQIDYAMDACASRQKILVLDCCYSGAFPASRISKADAEVHTLERFQGKGRVVLTASDATQYSFEGNHIVGHGTPRSLFTHFLVKGLTTGEADLDSDGDITLDELYSYVHDRVVQEMPQQRPKKQEDVEGRIVIARNIHWCPPAPVRDAIESKFTRDRDDHRRSSANQTSFDGDLGPASSRGLGPRSRHRIIIVACIALLIVSFVVISWWWRSSTPSYASLVSTIPVGTDPTGVAVTPDGRHVYIPNRGSNNVSVIDTASNTVSTSIPVGNSPSAAAVTPDGHHLLVTNHDSGTVSVIETASNTVSVTIPHVHDSPLDVAITPDGRRAYVSGTNTDGTGNRTISVVDIATNTSTTLSQPGTLTDSPARIAIAPKGHRAYVTNLFAIAVAIIDTTTNTRSGDIQLLGNDVAVSPDGRRVYITDNDTNTIAVVDADTNTIASTIPVGGNEIVLSADGSRAYVTNSGADTVTAINMRNLATTLIAVGDEPAGLAVTPDGRHIYVANRRSGTVSVIDAGVVG